MYQVTSVGFFSNDINFFGILVTFLAADLTFGVIQICMYRVASVGFFSFVEYKIYNFGINHRCTRTQSMKKGANIQS